MFYHITQKGVIHILLRYKFVSDIIQRFVSPLVGYDFYLFIVSTQKHLSLVPVS